MLQAIHDKAKGWVAYAIIGFICIPFALWGINSYFEGGGQVNAAVVNGEEVPARQVQNQLSQIRRQLGGMADSLGDEQLKQMALDNVVNQTLLRQKAEEEGYRASNLEVARYIAQIFQTDGQFDPQQYQNFLSSQRRNQAEFEQQVREDLTLRQFRQGISSSAFIPESQAEYYQSLQNQQREVEAFTLQADDFEEQVTLEDEEVAEYYEQNKSRFVTEEKLKLDYVEINRTKLAENIEVSDERLQAYYDENADRYLIPEARNTSHILVSFTENAEEAAKKRIDALYAAINSGERTFEDVASNDSDDQVAAENNGVVGDVVRGDWDPDFEDAVFSLEVGKISEPVKTGAGFEIIRVNSIKEATQKTFAEARDEVEKDYRSTEAEKLYLDKADEVQTIAYEQSGDLAPAAEAAGLEVQTTGWITRVQGEGIAANPKVREAAFSAEVLQERKNSEPVEIINGQAVVVRVAEQEPVKQKPLEEVREEIVQILTDQKARELTAEKGGEMLAKLKEQDDWSALEAIEAGEAVAVEKVGKIERDSNELPPAVISKAFAMPRPGEEKASWDSVALANGDYVLIAVKSVEDAAAELEGGVSPVFSNSVSGRETSALLNALRERAEVELMPENI